MWVPAECETCYCLNTQATQCGTKSSRCEEVCYITGKIKIITPRFEDFFSFGSSTFDKIVQSALSGEDIYIASNDEFTFHGECRRMREEAVLAFSRYCSGIRMKGLRKIMKHLNSIVSEIRRGCFPNTS
jgi:hypothetical protein